MFTIPNKQKVSRQSLAMIPRPMPLGSRHQPLHHHDLISVIQKNAEEKNFSRINEEGVLVNDMKLELVGENHGLLNTSVGSGTELYSNLNFKVYRDEGGLFGLKEIEALNGNATFSMGVINSNAQKRALTFFPGAIIAVCTNGIMINDVCGDVIKKKHINSMAPRDQINLGLQSFCDATTKIEATYRAMKSQQLNSKEICEALISFGESGTMGSSMVFKTNAEYKSLKHKTMHGDGTVWSLYNAGTEVIKDSTMLTQKRVMDGMQADLVKVGLMPNNEELGYFSNN